MKPTEYNGTTTSGTQPRKNDNNGKGWRFQHNDDDKMSYEYILPIYPLHKLYIYDQLSFL